MTVCASKSPEKLLPHLLFLVLWGVLVFATPADAQTMNALSRHTVVIFNKNAPGSEKLARYYQEKRSIPEANVIGLDAPITEEISREEFVTKISAPLRAVLIDRKLWRARGKDVVESKLRFAVLMRGMPLKIRSALPAAQPGEKRHPVNDRDEASVDSEIAVLGLDTPANGAVVNPYYRSFQRAVDAALPPGIFLVSRLDAPREETVRRMIDDSLSAERRGLGGWAYIDARGIESGPYHEGDRWLANARESMRRKGIPVISDQLEPTLPQGFPVRQAAVYYGWYAGTVNGPFAEKSTQFQRGGIAVHIHSFSAASLRSATAHWAGPLVEAGAAVSAGNVYEPYLSLTLNPDIFQDRLMNGFTVAEAAFAATPVVSWMWVVLGDPLYQPYASWFSADLGSTRTPDEWGQFRKIVLEKNGNWNVAAPFLENLGRRLQNPMPSEALACWLRDEGRTDKAVEAFRAAEALASQPWQKAQIRWLLLRTLSGAGQKKAAREVAASAFSDKLSESEAALFQKEFERLSDRPVP